MHLKTDTPSIAAPYPSIPSPVSSEDFDIRSHSPNGDTMSSKGITNVDGLGSLTYQRAIDIARNTEGDLDSSVNEYLENAVTDIWTRINENQDSYILSRDEFAVFNYYIRRFEGSPIAEKAVDRYWRMQQGEQR